MHKIILELTNDEREALRVVLEENLRWIQGNGQLEDRLDDALVTLNDKIEAALRGQ